MSYIKSISLEVYLYTIVFLCSIILFLTFITITNYNQNYEQTYEMTDHQLNQKYILQHTTYEHSELDNQSSKAVSVQP
ncbi:DNA damage-induced cell division inhibitor SosA [Staphylococcus sp. 11261D007BR]